MGRTKLRPPWMKWRQQLRSAETCKSACPWTRQWREYAQPSGDVTVLGGLREFRAFFGGIGGDDHVTRLDSFRASLECSIKMGGEFLHEVGSMTIDNPNAKQYPYIRIGLVAAHLVGCNSKKQRRDDLRTEWR